MIYNNEKSWYVIQIHTKSEDIVKSALLKNIEDNKMQDYFGEILIPSEEVMEMKNSKKRKSIRKFFPGYLLINMIMNENTWHLVNNLKKVSCFIGNNNPLTVSNEEINKIINNIKDSQGKPKPKVLYEVGEVIRVVDGAFKDFSGVIEKVNYEKSRVWVGVSIFGRSTPVELNFYQIEKE
jgi:transcriptional antiterminator NusG